MSGAIMLGASYTGSGIAAASSGLIQAAGALQLVGGFIFLTKRLVARTAGVHVIPTADMRSAGVAAIGRF